MGGRTNRRGAGAGGCTPNHRFFLLKFRIFYDFFFVGVFEILLLQKKMNYHNNGGKGKKIRNENRKDHITWKGEGKDPRRIF